MSKTMDQGSRFLCWSTTEIRRLFWIFGLAFGLVLILVRFLKLRDDNVLSYLSSAGNFALFCNTADSIKTFNHTIEGCTGGVDEYGLVHNSPRASPSLSNEIQKNATNAVSMPRMNELLLQSHSNQNPKMPRLFSMSDKELLRARSEIENAAPLDYNSGLYEPLYRNASKFKMSYELMDKMLRVYIYKEGEKPIFHESILEGIYASEGWFLKLLESNKKLITTDPTKAHLFYIPFSSRQLELTLTSRIHTAETTL